MHLREASSNERAEFLPSHMNDAVESDQAAEGVSGDREQSHVGHDRRVKTRGCQAAHLAAEVDAEHTATSAAEIGADLAGSAADIGNRIGNGGREGVQQSPVGWLPVEFVAECALVSRGYPVITGPQLVPAHQATLPGPEQVDGAHGRHTL